MDLMDLQDVIRCHLCDTPVPTKHCDICHIHLCEDCEKEHISDESTDHYIVPFKMRGKIPDCQEHSTKICTLHCKQCHIPICQLCVSSGNHKQHENIDILKNWDITKKLVLKDLQEFKESIYPEFKEAESFIPDQKADFSLNSQNLKTALKKQRDDLDKEIDTIYMSMQSEIEDMDSEYLEAIGEKEAAIGQTINEMDNIIQDLKRLHDTDDVLLVSKYKSRNEEFRKMTPKLTVSFPNFQPQKINIEMLRGQFGNMSPLSITTEVQDSTLPSSRVTSSTPGMSSLDGLQSSVATLYLRDRPLLDVPHIIAEIVTEYKKLFGVACLSDEEIWTRGDDSIMKLYNLQGVVVKSVRTQSNNNWPQDIVVTRDGDLLFLDRRDSSIYKLSNSHVTTLIRQIGSTKPHNMCLASSGDLLVIFDSKAGEETKLVRYSGSKEVQRIQRDDRGYPIFSSGMYTRCLTENRNLDICVADYGARELVVVNAAGKLRFRYTGIPHAFEESFQPFDVTTDSQAKILVTDHKSPYVHVLDQDGHFLRYIDTCDLHDPRGLCVDSRDNLFVAERNTGKVKKIQYYE